jgi:hypothetical protein
VKTINDRLAAIERKRKGCAPTAPPVPSCHQQLDRATQLGEFAL